MISCCLVGKLMKRIHYDKEISFIPITKEYIEIHRSKIPSPPFPSGEYFYSDRSFFGVWDSGWSDGQCYSENTSTKYSENSSYQVVEVGLR